MKIRNIVAAGTMSLALAFGSAGIADARGIPNVEGMENSKAVSVLRSSGVQVSTFVDGVESRKRTCIVLSQSNYTSRDYKRVEVEVENEDGEIETVKQAQWVDVPKSILKVRCRK